MTDYVASALFVYTDEGAAYIEPLQQNSLGVSVSVLAYDTLKQNPSKYLREIDHVVISGSMDFHKELVRYSLEYDFSIGIIPLPNGQKRLARLLALPDDLDDLIEIALRNDPQSIDLILCNEKILFFKASIGRIPLIDIPAKTNWLRIFWEGQKLLWSLRLLPFSITVAGDQQTDIHTAASGCMIIQHHKRSLASKLIAHDSSNVDGMISLVIVAPFSLVDYIKFFFQTIIRTEKEKSLPAATGYIKSPELIIDTEKALQVDIDGESTTTTPLHCKVLPEALRVNLGEVLQTSKIKATKVKELINVKALPSGKELVKAKNRKVPFFSYASEERFKDLFTALRDDARIDLIYLVLMALSTILATTGLYLNSASVIIGAMLLAPLMAPIISLAMGLLRQDELLMQRSITKIVVGVFLALLTAALMTLFFAYKPVTAEMEARLSPTVLDLLVAITAGAAGAYTKSYKEILQSLAGVAIAVALVPPLAVAGIGIGRLDPEFFGHAFLLFSTNLVGIILAATLTFRVLGYSAAVKSKRGIGIVFLLFVLISIPLYLSYNQIVENRALEQSWKEERFLVHGKYLIVQQARLTEYGHADILTMNIQSREQLTRSDLAELKRKVKYNFSEDLVIRANIIYIP